MSRNVKLFAIIGGVLILVAGGIWIAEGRAPAPPAQDRGFAPH